MEMEKELHLDSRDIASATAKRPYVPPSLEVFEYAVELGFTNSPKGTPMGETFSEINDETELGHAGENYHGEWY